ncbi:lovastatin nonaketide synthase [Podospora fimiseda]|uniref:Lovastatin nonaketide synthase n=1 Tax=Podospora fimiseda TaxID=252190 RepID=A0AAN7BJG0_9PEZI|nr:lovastatin nonaketide synthase [Podospora fimiseda]
MASQQPSEPIAIVGSGCRFPGGASSPSALWELLKQPRDVLREIPVERFDTTGYFHPDGNHHTTSNVKHMHHLEQDLGEFDAQFFFISPNEADSIDPQQRLLLETVYEALEAGGHSMEALRGSDTAVYCGTMGCDYNDTIMRDFDSIPTYAATGTSRAIISNRVSYVFDWHGPSMTIDTACSSSLIAVHQGVQALRTKESRVAVACGTQIILGPELFILESKLKMLSPTGRSRMWDADADGYARGEGVAALVMKRLSDAIADGDDIQCIIRETGTNQDGFSNGITVPSSVAQAALIRKTYAKAGLDLTNPLDHPQFFEAHGTGTKAGDPKEAAAIYECFSENTNRTKPLYVGSVKTVIGHTEGAAGLAGLLKGVASIQAGIIPPNLLFNRLNPDIEPFYKGLEVPTALTPWPTLPEGVPKRVSVNSFGFGGSNAHAILEEYVKPASSESPKEGNSFLPFLFSAASETSLAAQLEAYSNYLKKHQDSESLNLTDLAWTLQARRSQHPFKASFSAGSLEGLAAKIDTKLASAKQQNSAISTRSGKQTEAARILGVFTGQGAQWASMGTHLIRESPSFVAKRIQDLEQALDILPKADRPQWRLRDELLAGADKSRLSEAELSQPLCTAIQIVLVDMLRSAGITFSAVVGHSSGEIAAAYAAGFLSDVDAVRVAYYRGVYAKLAGSYSGASGAMLAVGTSLEDAEDLVALSAFKGRLAVAAHNSSASVTLSGDIDAVVLAKKVFDEEKKFARLLKVDKAYHSNHMLPCGDPYVAALTACGVKVRSSEERKDTNCVWFSSVFPDSKGVESTADIQGEYWRDNMTRTVLFADAVKNAVSSDPKLSLAIEVGPHPALKGPATLTISDVLTGGSLPYTGVLSRGQNDVEAFADALGFIWTQLGAQSVGFDNYHKTVAGEGARQPQVVTGLPSYQWNHARRHWYESRRSHKIRGRKQPFHELLGIMDPGSSVRELRWNNVLKVSEIPWLEGHQLQGQTVFPAAGYVAMALEAARCLAEQRGTKEAAELFELHDLTIIKAITFDEDVGIETQVTLTQVRQEQDGVVAADFSCYSCTMAPTVRASEQPDFEIIATGTVKIVVGTRTFTALAAGPAPDTTNMSDVDTDRFYSSLLRHGYGYSGQFRTMSSIKRRLNQASVRVASYPYADNDEVDERQTVYLVHPTMLDVAFQSSILAFSAPYDGRLWSLHVPTAIGRIRVNPEVCAALPRAGFNVPVRAVVSGSEDHQESFGGSTIDILGHDEESSMVQVEDLVIKPFAPATAADDRRLFSYTKWDVAGPDGPLILPTLRPTPYEEELGVFCEKVSFYYMRKWKAELTSEEWANGQEHHHRLLDYVNHVIETVAAGKHRYVKKEWSNETLDDMADLMAKYGESVDIRILKAVGENMAATVRGETTILEHMRPNNMLDDFYVESLGLSRLNIFLAGMITQMVHRYPHARILEIGAGTGGATKSVLSAIGHTMSSYTYTDISPGFFDQAAEVFEAYRDKMTFKVLDIERSPASQGFELANYDIIIASNVLHATAVMERTMEHTRQLLRPGGYVVLAELTNSEPLRYGGTMGGLRGWWLGADDGRKYSPLISRRGWHTLLRKVGFAGVDTMTPDTDNSLAWPFSIMAAQAVDERINMLRRPLVPSKTSIYLDNVVIMGTGSLETSRMAEELAEYLMRFSSNIITLDGLPTEEEAETLDPMSTFINLTDLDSPIFQGMTEDRMQGLKRVFDLARHVLWVTHGALTAENPYHMASMMFNRAMRHEAGHVGLHRIDLSELEPTKYDVSKAIAEHLLRQAAVYEWELETPRTPETKGIQRYPIMWSKEQEVFLDKRGKILIPRLMDNPKQNARLNSDRRTIYRTVSLSEKPELNVSIELGGNASPALIEQDAPAASQVRSEGSTLKALSVAGSDFLFVGTGKDVESKENVVFLSRTNSAIADNDSIVGRVGVQEGSLSVLVAVASELLASSVVEKLSAGSSIVVHSAAPRNDRLFAVALKRRADAKEVRTIFISSVAGPAPAVVEGVDWVPIDEKTPKNAQKRILLRIAGRKVTHFLDLSNEKNTFAALLPTAKTIELGDLARLDAQVSISQDVALSVLNDAVRHVKDTSIGDDLVVDVAEIHQQEKQQQLKHINSVVRWPQSDSSLEVQVRPLNARRLFSPNKSYLLVGLTGEIGRSVCEWMVTNGAGCVCLASRTPKANQSWIDSFEGTGATIKVYQIDVTDKASVARVVSDIRATCPPIGGVANGAMVLHDILFANMTLQQMNVVLGPKIDGSYNLDDIFRDEPLDFFLLLSSSVIIVGNSGQSNYAAANGYVNALVRHRRKRGLAASAVDIGHVAGIGYVETAGQHVWDQLERAGIPRISETELHRMFAESIQAGYPSPSDSQIGNGVSFMDSVVTTGVRAIRDDEDVTGLWFEDPFFSHGIVESSSASSGSTSDQQDQKKNLLPIRDQIAAASNEEEVLDVLQQDFAAKLCSILQTSSDALDHDAPLVELGMDSLVAVKVRSWWLKELKVDIPVLKLVGGSSLADISRLAVKKLPEELLSKVGTAPKLPSAPAPAPIPAVKVAQSVGPSSSSTTYDSMSTSGVRTPLPVETPPSTIVDTIADAPTAKPHQPLIQTKSYVRSEPISLSQSRFWFLRLLLQDPTTFNVCLKYRLSGRVRVGDLENSLRVVAARHESLRTVFIADKDEVGDASQKVLARSPVKLETKTVNSEEEAVAVYQQLRTHIFDLENGPLIRMMLITLSPNSHHLLVNCHHIITDMDSLYIIFAEMEKAYNGQPLGPPPRQYPEFSVAQRKALENRELDDDLKYWQKVFPAGEQPPVLPLLPMARSTSRVAMTDYAVHQVRLPLKPEMVARVKAVSKAQRSTPFHFYVAAYKAMLFSFTDAEDLTIGIADANRSDTTLAGTVGFFVNLLTLRFRRQNDQKFSDAIVEARNTFYGALGHSRLPFDVLLKELGVVRSSSHSPFFQAFIDYRPESSAGQNWCHCKMVPAFDEFHPGRTGYDISLDIAEIGSETHIFLRAQKAMYDLTGANLLLETFAHFVDILSQDASLTLENTPLFSQQQLDVAVKVGRGPELVQAWPDTLPHRIDQVTKENPNSIALMDGLDNELTYSAMLNRIQSISEALSSAGVGPAARVIVFQQAAADWICSMLAIMRIGAVYVPLDLRNPIERLAVVADNCQPTAVLADDSTIRDAPRLRAPVIINISTVPSEPSAPVENIANPNETAAILYTSGSTGAPKGIIVRHSGIRNQMEGYTKTYKIGAERVLQQSAFTFNFTFDQIFTGLTMGGMVYVVPWAKRGDPLSITEIMRNYNITYTKVTPSEYSMWIQFGFDNLKHATNWRFAFGGGEPMTDHVLQQFSSLGLEQLRLLNSYGQTEISIASHKGLIDYNTKRTAEYGPIPCGFSLPNYSTYVVDKDLKPLPVGMPGEVVTGGPGVCLGYLTDQERTARVFVTNPFATPEDKARGWTRMHRTGDIGHLQADGSLVFRGRIAGDMQLKLRGLRIDLRDIESNMVTTSGGVLKEAIVSLRRGDPDFLVSHVVFSPQAKVDDRNAFLENLLGRLPIPQYMIPLLAIPLDALPLNSHHKVDRRAIGAMDLPRRVVAQDDAGLSETATQLRNVWRSVLGKDSEKLGLAITPSTNFFTIGGNSLLVVRLQSRIRQVFNVTVRLVDLLNASTLAQMAQKVEEAPSAGVIDWDQETSPPSVSDLSDAPVFQSPKKGLKSILVTGATGNLASYLLPLLVADPRIGKIHCVALREKPSRELPQSDKIIRHRGDLSSSLLGLDEEEFSELSREVDVILHLGSLRAFWDNYHILRATNVQSTRELIQLAAPRRIPIHFVSTSGVLPQDILADNATSAAAYPPTTDGSDGYVASKWVNERLLERSAEILGVPSFVYRLLPADNQSSQQQNKQNVLNEFLRCIDIAGVLPDWSEWDATVSLISSHSVAEKLAQSVLSAEGVSETTTQFTHFQSPIAVGVEELKAFVEEKRGEKSAEFERLPVLKWTGKLKAAGFGFVLASMEMETTSQGAEGVKLTARR